MTLAAASGRPRSWHAGLRYSRTIMTETTQSALDPEAFQAFRARAQEGPVRMLNLLKFNAGGAEGYQRYMAATAPLLAEVGGKVVLAGKPAELLIGDQSWDLALIVEYPRRAALLAMLGSEAYQAIAHLRSDAVERSVLYALDPVAV